MPVAVIRAEVEATAVLATDQGHSLVRRPVERYSTGMRVAIELPQAQAEQLEREAKRLGVPAEDLARAAVTDFLAAPDATFQAAATRILAHNRELYRRLA